MMTSESATLVLEQGARVLSSAPLEGPAPEPIEVDETHTFGLHLSWADPELEYRIRIGSLPIEWGFEGESRDPATGSRTGNQIFWPEGAHFDGACGPTRVVLESRPRMRGARWTHRAELRVDVVPAKLGATRYRAMVDELRALSPELVFDHAGRSARADLPNAPPAMADVLAGLEATWQRVAGELRRAGREPRAPLPVSAARHGRPGVLSVRRLNALAFRGVDPRSTATRTLPAARARDEGAARAVLRRLERFEARVSDIARTARAEVVRLDRHRDFRDVQLGARRSIYETTDRPHVQQMEEVHACALGLREQVEAAAADLASRAAHAGREELQHPSRLLARVLAGPHANWRIGEFIKLTSRMYEQWVFLQLVAAFRALGLEPVATGTTIAGQGHAHLDRDATHAFHVRSSLLRLHYEPWIHPIDRAATLGEPLYREGDEETASWSPDVLIEVVRSNARETVVQGAIVVDAKYTRAPGPAQWDRAAKYLAIRERRTGRPAVRQVWLACPTPTGRLLEIEDHDADVGWPTRRRGILELIPSAYDPARGPFSAPADVAVRFAEHALDEMLG